MLQGVKIIEFAAIGPVPWAVDILQGLGAEVLRIGRPGTTGGAERCKNVTLDLKNAVDCKHALSLVADADILIEGMRPGVMERLHLGPMECFSVQPRLIFARMTGWGQTGPLAHRAGHDINYIALTGALHAIGSANGPPVPPLNLLGDFGGGGSFLVIGVLAAMQAVASSGIGQVVDVAMIDGVARLLGPVHQRLKQREWIDARGSNNLDGAAPWYGVYETKDAKYMAVGAIEPNFYSHFVAAIGLDLHSLPDRAARENWPVLRRTFEMAFIEKTRDAWERVFEECDACVTPVLSLEEAPGHPHNIARNLFSEQESGFIPNFAPRFSARQ
jgi:alpha-methylacyl-CoA racemase